MASSIILSKCLIRNSTNLLKKSSTARSIIIQTVNQLNTKTVTPCVASNTNLKQTKQPNLYTNNRFLHTTRYLLNDLISIETPPFAESVKEGQIKFLKKVGDAVKADEIIAEVETDKTTLNVPSPKDGVIEQLLVPNDSVVTALAKIAVLRAGAAAAASSPAVEASKPVEAPKQAPPPPPPPSPSSQPIPTSAPPRTESVPKQPISSIPVSSVPVTPFKTAAAPQSDVKQDINKINGTRSETRVKMSKMRQTVASRLKTAQNTCAMLTTFNEINMGNIVELRKAHGDAFLKKHNLKLGFMSAFVKASANALLDQPIVNAVIENNEIVYRDYVDISVAVATPKGLVVPVLRNCGNMSYADIEREIFELGEKARTNKLAIEDMQGGTFTISNGGVFGSMFGTPIINLPQSAILGMHGIFDRPVAINGQVVIKPMMYVALTYDHRLIDGREAVTFLRKIKSAVEDPRTLLLDL